MIVDKDLIKNLLKFEFQIKRSGCLSKESEEDVLRAINKVKNYIDFMPYERVKGSVFAKLNKNQKHILECVINKVIRRGDFNNFGQYLNWNDGAYNDADYIIDVLANDYGLKLNHENKLLDITFDYDDLQHISEEVNKLWCFADEFKDKDESKRKWLKDLSDFLHEKLELDMFDPIFEDDDMDSECANNGDEVEVVEEVADEDQDKESSILI